MRPHAHLDRPRSALARERIRRHLTLEEESRLTGGRLSISHLWRMEHLGAGSPSAWKILAEALAVSLEQIAPDDGSGRPEDGRQIELLEILE